MELRPVNKINVTWTILFSFCVLRSSFFVLRSSSLLFIFLVLRRIWIRISFSLSLNSLFILKNPNNSLCFFFHPFTAAVSELSLSLLHHHLFPASAKCASHCRLLDPLAFPWVKKAIDSFFLCNLMSVFQCGFLPLFFSPYFLPFLLFLRK